jgi:DNA-binding NtrC family response regulator
MSTSVQIRLSPNGIKVSPTMVSDRKRRILFVDDEQGIRVTLPPILEKHGFTVKAAANVPDAFSLIDQHRFDVLLSDLNINKDADGLLLIASMCISQPRCRNFILTAYPSFETAQQGIRQSIDGYFTKPVDVENLVAGIRAKLSESYDLRPRMLKRKT